MVPGTHSASAVAALRCPQACRTTCASFVRLSHPHSHVGLCHAVAAGSGQQSATGKQRRLWVRYVACTAPVLGLSCRLQDVDVSEWLGHAIHATSAPHCPPQAPQHRSMLTAYSDSTAAQSAGKLGALSDAAGAGMRIAAHAAAGSGCQCTLEAPWHTPTTCRWVLVMQRRQHHHQRCDG